MKFWLEEEYEGLNEQCVRLRKQNSELQARNNALVKENRYLQKCINELLEAPKKDEVQQKMKGIRTGLSFYTKGYRKGYEEGKNEEGKNSAIKYLEDELAKCK